MQIRPTSEGLNRSFSDSIVDYNPNSELVCCFYTLVFRVDALEEKYPGGHMAFLLAHQGWSNADLLAVFQMGTERRKIFHDLERHHLKEELDWVQLKEDDVTWSWNMFNFETQAAWLKGRYKKGNIYVRYTGDVG